MNDDEDLVEAGMKILLLGLKWTAAGLLLLITICMSLGYGP